MHISPRPVDLQSPRATRPAFGGYMPWSVEAPSPGPLLPRPIAVCAARDEEIVAQDDEAEHCYMIVSGCVRTVRLMQDGRRQVGEFLLPGDVFGWDALDKHDFGAEAVTQVTLHRFSRSGLAALAEKDCTLSRRIRELTAMQVRAGREHMILLGRMTAFERIASFLLEMARRMKLDGRSHVELPMNRADIADYLGLTTETVCRQLTQLRRDRTIAINGTKFTIADRRTLEAAGCEGAIH
jgi:CRP/FNR family transcriptional regulator, nitrogen fixation regulation protein